MKFWDTIAKMCGIHVQNDKTGLSVVVRGHGVAIIDRTFVHHDRGAPRFSIGLIDIERIRPMKSKSANVREWATDLERAARNGHYGTSGFKPMPS